MNRLKILLMVVAVIALLAISTYVGKQIYDDFSPKVEQSSSQGHLPLP